MIAQDDLEHVFRHTGSLWEDLRGSRIFITGGTGFVGTWLVEALVHANREFSLDVSAVLLSRRPDVFRARAPHLAGDRAISMLEGDATNFERPRGEFDFVIHAATERSFEPDEKRPLGILEPDFIATRRVLDLAAISGARRVLFTSSGAVYGTQPPRLSHVDEDYAGAPDPMSPRAAYGHSKRLSETLCALYSAQFGFTAVIARLFAFVGPYLPLDEGYAIGDFMGNALRGEPITISGDGTPFRSYLYAADLAVWLWTMLLRGQSRRPYNVGSPHPLTIRALAEEVASSVAPTSRVDVLGRPVPGALPPRYVPSTQRAENELGLRAWIPLTDGIHRTVAWHRRPLALNT